MRIAVGQDALGCWAWMLLDDSGRLLDSDDNYYTAELAMEAASDALKVRARRSQRKLETC